MAEEHIQTQGTGASKTTSANHAVVEIYGDDVSVTLHRTAAAAEAYAVYLGVENTTGYAGEITDNLRLTGAHAEGDYQVVLAAANEVSLPARDQSRLQISGKLATGGDGTHHSDMVFSDQDKLAGGIMAGELGDLFVNSRVESPVVQWEKVMRALRCGGFDITFH